MKYTAEQIKAIADKLRALPPVEKKKPDFNKRETIAMLKGEIASLKKRGYTLEQITDCLRGEGLVVATPTLRSYLNRTKANKKATVRSTKTAEPKHVEKASATFTPKPDSSDI